MGKNEYFKFKKKLILCDQQIFKFLNQLKENSINYLDFFNFIVSF
jgi:hypothetical protein